MCEPQLVHMRPMTHLAPSNSTAKDSSVVAVQIFDQRKFKRKDQGFLGVVNVRVSDILDFELGGHGGSSVCCTVYPFHGYLFRDANPRSQKVK